MRRSGCAEHFVIVRATDMRLICFWCLVVGVVRAQDEEFYAPQTYRQVEPALFQPMGRPWNLKPSESYPRPLFAPASEVQPTTVVDQWRQPAPVNEWRGAERNTAVPGASFPKSEPWRLPYSLNKEQQASILHHKQSLSSEGAFRYEYASDNGLAAGETIEPDGTRVGAYQYKDPSGQLVKLKYRAGKEGFQILEGSHIPKSPEPVAPPSSDNYNQQAYTQQRQQFELQQQHNQQRPETSSWGQSQQAYTQQRQRFELQQQRPETSSWGQSQGPEGQRQAGGQAYFLNNYRPSVGAEDDGQYRENEVDNNRPHSFGDGYAFAFQG